MNAFVAYRAWNLLETKRRPLVSGVIMWSLILYLVAVIVGLVLFHMYDESAENEDSLQACNSAESAVKPHVSDFRFTGLFAVLGFSVPGDTSEERFESFTEHFTTFDEVILNDK